MEEYIDVCSEDGTRTGESLPRRVIHEKGLLHRVTNVILMNSNYEILLQKRANIKESFPCLWDISSSGHISAGDDSLTSAQRETEEELGVHIDLKEFEFIQESRSFFVLHDGKYIDNEIVDIYLVQKDIPLDDFKVQESEVEKVKWYSLSEIKNMVDLQSPILVPPLYGTTYEKIWPYLKSRFDIDIDKSE